jgi:imidazolonepropionase-like amidohydrolase
MNWWRAGVTAATIVFAAGAATPAQGPASPPYRPAAPIAITGGLLLDGSGGPPRHDQTVLIQGERIVAVGPAESVKVPLGAHTIDATGMTIMPGLINSNQHIQLNPLFPSPAAGLPLEHIKARWERTWSAMERRAFVYLMQGVTSMRNTSGPAKRLLTVKTAIDRGDIPGPRLFLGGALFMSRASFDHYIAEQNTPPDAVAFMRDEFAYAVIDDVDKDTDRFTGPEFNYWKLLMSSEKWNGSNDFTDKELRRIIEKGRRHGKKIDVHCGSSNDGLRRMVAFDVDTLEHPFYRHELIDWDIIEGYTKKGVIVDTLLIQMISEGLRASDPHRFNETLYAMSMDPAEYRILLRYRDTMLANAKSPDKPGTAYYDPDAPPDVPSLLPAPGRAPRPTHSLNELKRRIETSKENMRRFIKAGAKFSMGTDTGAFLNLQQEDPNAREMMLMVEIGMPPLEAIKASTRNGAEALGLASDLGTVEAGKLADVIVVAGNPLQDMSVMKRIAVVVKGGVRYK